LFGEWLTLSNRRSVNVGSVSYCQQGRLHIRWGSIAVESTAVQCSLEGRKGEDVFTASFRNNYCTEWFHLHYISVAYNCRSREL